MQVAVVYYREWMHEKVYTQLMRVKVKFVWSQDGEFPGKCGVGCGYSVELDVNRGYNKKLTVWVCTTHGIKDRPKVKGKAS